MGRPCPTGVTCSREVESRVHRLRSRADPTADDADLRRSARTRNRQAFLRKITKVQIDRLAGLLDRMVDRASRGCTADDVGDRHAEQARIARLLDLDRKAQAERTGRDIRL